MGLDDIIYYGLHALALVMSIVWTSFVAKKLSIKKGRMVAITIGIFSTAYAGMLLMYWAIKGSFGGQNLIRVFVILAPFIFLWSKICKIPFSIMLGVAAPVPALAQFFGKFGCMVCGCCYSWIQVDWGIYNPITGTKLFPVQLVEGIVAGAIAAFLMYYFVKNKFENGTDCYIIMLCMFGTTRVFLEYLRESDKYYLGLSELAFWSLAMVVEGVIWLIVREIVNKKKSSKQLKKSN